MKRRPWLIFAALTFSPLFALGQSGQGQSTSEEVFRKRGEDRFQALDVDKNGYLEGEEIPGEIRAILNQAMASPDTRLSLGQLLKYREAAYLLQVASNFKNHDRNNDGLLQKHEMPLSLLKRLEQYSSGRDLVNFQEFVQFSRDRDYPPPLPTRVEPTQTKGTAPETPLIIDYTDVDLPRPIVYRAARLPKGLPEWFEKLDVDKDGQIALFEWRNAGRPIEEFEQWDLNDDGLMTFAEVLYKLRMGRTPRAKSGF